MVFRSLSKCDKHSLIDMVISSLSNVVLMDEKFTSFHQYRRPSQKWYHCVQYTRRHFVDDAVSH